MTQDGQIKNNITMPVGFEYQNLREFRVFNLGGRRETMSSLDRDQTKSVRQLWFRKPSLVGCHSGGGLFGGGAKRLHLVT